jgi:uncharacterized protein (DUF1697 family)
METYISMLRGINVGGKVIKMDALREMCSQMGLKDVRTYIQSGNIIYSYKKILPKKLDALLNENIKKSFGYDVPVITLTVPELQAVIKTNPMSKQKSRDQAFMHVTLLDKKPESEKVKAIMDGDYQGHEFEWIDRAIYLYTPGGYGNTKLNNSFFEKKLKVSGTTRNWKTINELLKMAEEKE